MLSKGNGPALKSSLNLARSCKWSVTDAFR